MSLDIQAKESYRELLNFLRFFKHSGTPTIIGGWAVFLYNPYQGSVDIDVVGPSMGSTFKSIIDRYVVSNGYDLEPLDALGLSVTPIKRVRDKRGNIVAEIELDVATFEDLAASKFHENSDKGLPYGLCWETVNRREVHLEDCAFYIPSKTLLFLFKVKALRDRIYDLATKGPTMSARRVSWLRRKALKDKTDLLALFDEDPPRKPVVTEAIDSEIMGSIIGAHRLEFIIQSIEELAQDAQALAIYQHYNPRLDEKKVRDSIQIILHGSKKR